jgi:hypothetical protein
MTDLTCCSLGAARFAQALDQEGQADDMRIFCGDAYSPSIVSCITKGSHMVDILSELRVDVGVYGNQYVPRSFSPFYPSARFLPPDNIATFMIAD